jgi:hypothetical protein
MQGEEWRECETVRCARLCRSKPPKCIGTPIKRKRKNSIISEKFYFYQLKYDYQ